MTTALRADAIPLQLYEPVQRVSHRGPGSGGGPTGSSAWKMYDAKGHALAYVLYKNKQGWFDKQHGGSDCEDGSAQCSSTRRSPKSQVRARIKNELTLSICGSIASDQRDVKSAPTTITSR